MKLFVSYRSTNSSKVDPIVHRLRSLKYDVWQDKDSIPVGQDWWEAICEGIRTSDVFLFMISKESVKSINCIAEWSYAHELNLPIIPFVIEGEWTYNSGGKHDVDFWDEIPEELVDSRAQFLFYEGVSFVDKLQTGIKTLLDRNMPRLPADPPPDPRRASDATNDVTVIYDEAYDFAYRGELQHAKKLFRKLVRHNDPIFGAISLQWVHIIDEYTRIKNMADRSSTRKIAERHWTVYTGKFPYDFMDGIFDPANVISLLTNTVESVSPTASILLQPVEIITPTSKSLMPAPFDWIEIPGKGYSIAKYPVTNAQYRVFVDEYKGYENDQWWTQAGLEAKAKGWHYDGGWKASGKAWTEPRYWTDKKWNGDTQPVVGVSWYEAVAFCLWLREVTGEKIMLPTEDQWQYAAQGDDGRVYPWGNDWDCKRCNNSVKPCDSHGTTPVTQYEGEEKGNSRFGVVDMAGNVWEWGLTDYNNKTNDINSPDNRRDLRGGSWDDSYIADFRCASRYWADPHHRYNNLGFRVSRLNPSSEF